jgi:hypothetical protein
MHPDLMMESFSKVRTLTGFNYNNPAPVLSYSSTSTKRFLVNNGEEDRFDDSKRSRLSATNINYILNDVENSKDEVNGYLDNRVCCNVPSHHHYSSPSYLKQSYNLPSSSSIRYSNSYHPSSLIVQMESGFSSPTPSSPILLRSKVFKTHKSNTKYIEIGAELLRLRQNDAARRLGLAPSTFSKRWRQTLPDRKWPFR